MNRPSVLLIDDDELFRQSLGLMLDELGYAVREAADGEAGLEEAARAAVDLVITDIIMPKKEGIETIMELRRLHPHLKIVAISGGGRFGPREYLPTAQLLGAQAVLEKPFTIEQLSHAIGPLLPTRSDAEGGATDDQD